MLAGIIDQMPEDDVTTDHCVHIHQLIEYVCRNIRNRDVERSVNNLLDSIGFLINTETVINSNVSEIQRFIDKLNLRSRHVGAQFKLIRDKIECGCASIDHGPHGCNRVAGGF